MVIYKRTINCSKSYEEICAILKSAAYHGECQIDNNNFSLLCSKRTFQGRLMLQRVSGHVVSKEQGSDVIFEVHGGIELIIAIAIGGFGIIGFIFGLLFAGFGKATFGLLTSVGMGLLIACIPLCRGIEMVDLLEYKLV